MGCSHFPNSRLNQYSSSCSSCSEKLTMRFKSNKAGTAEAGEQSKKEEASASKSSSAFSSTSTWPSCQIPLKKQWHRRQAFMDNVSTSIDKENPFLAALESTKNEPLSSCLKDIDKTTGDAFKGPSFLIQPFSSQSMTCFRPKPKGLVDGLSRFFTPTNKRKSRVAISSLGDSLTLDGEMQINHAAGHSFSGNQLCDQNSVKKMCNSDFDYKHQRFSDSPTSGFANSSPSISQSSLGLSSVSSLNLFNTAKPSGSGQIKNLFDGLSHLYTTPADSRKRVLKGFIENEPSTKRLRKTFNSCTNNDFNTSVFCDRNSTGDILHGKNKDSKLELDSRPKLLDSDCEVSSFVSSPSCSSIKSLDNCRSEELSFVNSDSTLSYSQLCSSVPEKSPFGLSASQKAFISDVKTDVSITENEKIDDFPFSVTEDDRLLFQKVHEMAEQAIDVKIESPASGKPSLLQFGKYEIAVLYSSPYPKEYLRLSKIFLCEFCLKFMKSIKTLDRHMMKCTLTHPPADEIYRKGDISVFEVDGVTNKTYCQNLCLLAKMFLDHKTLFYDVESFLFYILTKNDKKGCHLVGYFSKERFCQQRYNVSCIMIMPQHQRKGYGRFLIDFSYLLSRKEGRCGTPEKPLSELGHLCYSSHWESAVLEHLCKIDREKKITVKSICKATGMTFADVVATLTVLNMIKRNDVGKILVTIDKKSLESQVEEINKKKSHRIVLDPNCLVWEPQMNMKINCKKCRKEASKLRDRKKQQLKSNRSEKLFIGGVWYSKERIKCETCLLSQERERRRLLKHKNKRKLTEKYTELDTFVEPRKKRMKLSSLHSSLMDSSDDSMDYLRYTTAKIRNLKRKLLKKHKMKMQKKYQEQKNETDILKYALLGESRSSKIKVHGFLQKSSKLNIECQKKFKHKRIKKERYKKLKKKDKSKNFSQELSKDKKKHKVKMKKKESKSSEKDTDRDGVTTPPVLLPAVLSEDDSSQSSNSASENDLSPPPLLQASMMESTESKSESVIEIEEIQEEEEPAENNVEQTIVETEEISEVVPEENEAVSEELSNEISIENILGVEEIEKVEEEKEEIILSPECTKPIEEICENMNTESVDDAVCTVETVCDINNDVDEVDRAVAPLLSSVENIEREDSFYNDDNCILEDDVLEKQDLETTSVSECEVAAPICLPDEEAADADCNKSIDSNAVEIVFEQTADIDMSSLHVPDQVHDSNHMSLHNELKNQEEENEVREAVEILNEQMEHSSNIDMPLTPQTPESEHSRSYHHLSPYHQQHECDGSVEEIEDPNNMDCQELEDDSVNKMGDDIQECGYAEHHEENIQQVHSNETYTPEMIEQPDIIVDMPQVTQPLSQASQISNPSTPVGTIVSKHTPTPQEMSSMGVYTPDSSTNSGYNSVEIDVCQLGLESPTSVCSSEIAQQNSVEARSSTPQSYPDCAQLNNSSPYCANASISEPCSNSNRREMIAAAAAAQAAVVQAQAQAHHTNHTNQSSHCVNVSNRKRQHSSGINQRITNIPPSGPVSSLMQSSMVSVNATAVNALFVGPAPNTNNGYMNAMNMSVPCSNATAGGGPVAGSYMVGVPVATVIQPQSAAAFAAASMQNHHQLQQSPQNFSVANHPTGTISGAMQRLTHVGVSPSIAPNTCPVSSVTPNFHIQSPSYTYTPTPTPTPNTPSQIGTSCSLAKLQQLTNGIMDIVPNPPCNTMTPPPNMTPPSPQVNMTPPPQMQRSLTPAMTSLQPQIPMQSGSHGYSKYHFHHRQMQRNANVALSPNLVASYQTINGVGYRIQQAPSAAAMLNTGYITNASFINQAQLPPSAAVQMGMVNVNMHGQTPYQETLQPNRPQNAMYTTYSYHISGNLQPQSLNSVMRR